MKNDQAAGIIAALIDKLSLNADEALQLEQAAEKVYDLGYEHAKNSYQRIMNPADDRHRPRESVQEAIQPKIVIPKGPNPGQPTV